MGSPGLGLRTVVRKTTLKEQDEAFCLALSIDERLKVLEEFNRIGRLADDYHVPDNFRFQQTKAELEEVITNCDNRDKQVLLWGL